MGNGLPVGNGPLAGRRVVITRAREQAGPLADALVAGGAEPVLVPTIAFEQPADGGAALRAGLAGLASYDWLLLTSVNAVDRVVAELETPALATVDRVSTPTVVIGSKTAEAAEAAGFRVALMPDDFVGEGLLAVMPSGAGTVLFPRAAIGRNVLLDGLAELGWSVDLVETYRTVAADIDPTARRLAADADAVTFTSPSTFASYHDNVGPPYPLVVSIGPVTSAAIEAAGISVDVEATPHTIDGLVAALVEFWGGAS